MDDSDGSSQSMATYLPPIEEDRSSNLLLLAIDLINNWFLPLLAKPVQTHIWTLVGSYNPPIPFAWSFSQSTKETFTTQKQNRDIDLSSGNN
jgi:hypothetical protein